MGRPRRAAQGGLIYRVWNRANARMTIFEKDEDYEAFERIIVHAQQQSDMRIVSYCPPAEPLASRALARRRR